MNKSKNHGKYTSYFNSLQYNTILESMSTTGFDTSSGRTTPEYDIIETENAIEKEALFDSIHQQDQATKDQCFSNQVCSKRPNQSATNDQECPVPDLYSYDPPKAFIEFVCNLELVKSANIRIERFQLKYEAAIVKTCFWIDYILSCVTVNCWPHELVHIFFGIGCFFLVLLLLIAAEERASETKKALEDYTGQKYKIV